MIFWNSIAATTGGYAASTGNVDAGGKGLGGGNLWFARSPAVDTSVYVRYKLSPFRLTEWRYVVWLPNAVSSEGLSLGRRFLHSTSASIAETKKGARHRRA